MSFDAAFIINLPLSTKRWEKISSRFDEAGFPYTKFEGVLGYNVNIKNTKTGYNFIGQNITKNPDLISASTIYEIKCNSNNVDFTLTGRKFNAGEIGGWCSHFLVWKTAIQKGYKNVLVFEDDFIPYKENFVSKVNAALKSTPNTYDLLYLHASISNGTKIPLEMNSPVSKFSQGSQHYLLMAYAFSKKFANNMVQLHHFTQSNDNYLNSRKDLEVYVSSNSFLDEVHSMPSIISMMGCRVYHKGTCERIHDAEHLDL